MRLLSTLLLLVPMLPAGATNTCPTGAPTTCVVGQGTWANSLEPRDHDGDGVIDAWYDTLLDLTWLADANYAQTSGFDADGRIFAAEAATWVGNLTLFGGTEWRLPTVAPVNGVAFNYTNSFNGSSDVGYSLPGVGWGTASEMGHMWYVTLGNEGLSGPVPLPDSTGPFRNLKEGHYQTAVPYGVVNPGTLGTMVWAMDMDNGRQGGVFRLGFGGGDDGGGGTRPSYLWPVHDGDLIGPPQDPAAQQVPLGVPALFVLGALLAAAAWRANASRGTGASRVWG